MLYNLLPRVYNSYFNVCPRQKRDGCLSTFKIPAKTTSYDIFAYTNLTRFIFYTNTASTRINMERFVELHAF